MSGISEADLDRLSTLIMALPEMGHLFNSSVIIEELMEADQLFLKFMSDGGRTDSYNGLKLYKFLVSKGVEQFEYFDDRKFRIGYEDLKRALLDDPKGRKLSKKEELDNLYKAWNNEEAHLKELESNTLNYMVIVSRVCNSKGKRYAKRSEYLFSSEEVAWACYKYWIARGGLNTLALLHVEEEYGYTQEPNSYC
jgi:hypothetical protein